MLLAGETWNIEEGGLNRKLGLTTTEILSHAHPGGVRSLFMMGENPMMSEPNLNQTCHHMQQLEFLVSQDLFINESGAFADVICRRSLLPRRTALSPIPSDRVQRVHKAVEPRGQARPDWQIICDLACRIEARLGRPTSAGWDYTHPSEILAEVGRNVPDYAGVTYERNRKIGPANPCAG